MTDSEDKISAMREGGQILGKILKELLNQVKPGVDTIKIDELAGRLIKESGGIASFKTVNGYKWSTCISVNDEVVHGVPDDVILEGDIVCIDVGLLYKGYHTDTAWTVQAGRDREIEKFLRVGEETLYKAIDQARVGNRIGQISKVIQDGVTGNGYFVVKSLVGHGVGKTLHESPQIPGYIHGKIENTMLIRPGMTLAIEVIYAMGTSEIEYKNDDGWTIVTADGSLSAVFEHTILVTDGKPEILTSGLTKRPI
ncbi:type I methionyl aminopeptidase [Candidatus Gottesmanbacteria bacterium]|nr:type I methionyl aminopeptidase [Candidatus Gottesmanbacteria bacterium]